MYIHEIIYDIKQFNNSRKLNVATCDVILASQDVSDEIGELVVNQTESLPKQ